MTRIEHLLVILSEECNEVAHRASKALRFGPKEVQKGQGFTNAQRIMYELNELVTTVEMLQEEGALPWYHSIIPRDVERNSKRERIEKYLLLSKACGTLDMLEGDVPDSRRDAYEAAPELLKACRNALSILTPGIAIIDEKDRSTSEIARDVLRAAIAKAEGK